MLASLTVVGFRGISRLELPDLTNINVLVGANSAGKTSVLEAIALALDGIGAYPYVLQHRDGVNNLPELLCRDRRTFSVEAPRRGAGEPTTFSFALDATTTPPRATFRGVDTAGGGQYLLPPDVESPRAYAGYAVRYIDIDRGRGFDLEEELAHLDTSDERAAFLDLVRRVRPSIADVRLVLVSGRPQVHVEEKIGDATARWPLSSGGDGLRRMMLLAGRMAGQHPVHLLEDPEAFQHPKALTVLADLLWRKADSSQLFITTHSIDFVRAMVERVNGEPLSLRIRVFVLDRPDDGVVRVVQMTGSQAQTKQREQQLRQALGYR